MNYALLTGRGYNLMEVISTVQKCIRRGEERDAMYWCMELLPKYEQYLWRRLLVIVNEDIGIAEPSLLAVLPALRAQFFEFRDQKQQDGPCRLILANALLLMCRARKSRIADEFQQCMSHEFVTGPRRKIPDYALDHHTGAGRRMGRGVDYWLKEGCQLNLPAEIDNPYHEEAEALWRAGKTDAPMWGARQPGAPKRAGQQALYIMDDSADPDL